MLNHQLLPVITASKAESIWRDVTQDEFRRNVVALQRASNEVPGDPKIHSRNQWSNPRIRVDDPNYVLPFSIEQRLADDFAFLAAAEEGVKTVSAVGLEQDIEHHGMIVRIAANDTVLQAVPKVFKLMFELLVRCAGKTLSRNLCSESLFNHVISLSRERIHGRLQSKHWKVPTHLRNVTREPLHQELRKIAARLERQRGPLAADSERLIKGLYGVCDLYQSINDCKEHTIEELELLKNAVRHSHALATSNGRCTIEETVSNHHLDSREICSTKVIRQLNKIGRYWGLCIDMAEASRKYGEIFENLDVKTIHPYQAVRSPISFVKGKKARCHVHAEIQLLIFYELNRNIATTEPRVLGASKSACYLCNMFILKHAHFFITKTHGRLYDQWNVPDLAELGLLQRNEFRQVLKSMNKDIRTNAIKKRRHQRHAFPLGSYVNLPNDLPQSAVHSSAATLDVVELQSRIEHLGSKAGPPRARSINPTPKSTPPLRLIPTPIPFTTLPANTETSLPRSPTSRKSVINDQPRESSEASSGSVSPVLSSTSVELWEIPTKKAVSATSPFRVSAGSLSLEIEFDGPSQGLVTVTSIAKSTAEALQNLIDVRSMDENELLDVTRADGDDPLIVNLNCGWPNSIQITFQWP